MSQEIIDLEEDRTYTVNISPEQNSNLIFT